MSSNAIKIIAIVFVVLAVILAVIGYKMTRNYAETATKATQQIQAQAAAQPTTEVVVAIKPLLADQPITSDDVKVVGVAVPPPDFYKNVEDVVKRIPKVDVDIGTPITPRIFGEQDPLTKLLPPGHKAVSLILNDVVGVGGFVRPGDIVDVLVYLRNDQTNKVDPAQARILLKDALVLASDERIIQPPTATSQQQQGQQQQQQQQQRRERTVVVAVPDDQVTRVMLGANMGEVRLALHSPPADQTQVAGAQPAQPAGAAAPAEVSAGPVAQNQQVAAAAKPGAEETLPDDPYTSAELGKLKPKRPVTGHGHPAGIVIYRGSKASTVYP
jgi:pilus assembly protein CpaB